MSEMSLRDDPRIETGKAALELAEQDAALRQGADAPPQPGDVFLFREVTVPLESTGDDDTLEWAVVERRPSDGRLLVVPLDDHPFVGSRDVALAPEALGGVAHLRCDLGVWLDASGFDPELRTGRLSEHDLGRVRRKRREISKGRATDSLLEEEVDGDPEYRRWCDALRDASAALPGRVDEIVPPVREPTGPSGVGLWRPLAFAATLVLALGLGWRTYHLQSTLDAERDRVDDLEARDATQQEEIEAQRERIEEASEEARRWESAYDELVAGTGEEVARQGQRIAELERALADDATQANVPLISFTRRDRVTRSGGALTYGLPTDTRRVVLALEIVDPEPYDRYRLRVVSKDTGEEVFASEELVKMDGRWLRLDLPAVLLPDGDYELLVDALTGEGFQPLDEGDELTIVRGFRR